MNEKDYHDAVAALFSRLETLLDDAGLDFDNNGNVIEITTDDDEKIIINKQTPMREVWLAARSGGRHFVFADDDWLDTRDRTPLLTKLRELLD